MPEISRRDALRVAADVLERSDWLTVELLADQGDENASENADRVVEILRALAAEPDLDAVEAERNRVLDVRRALVDEGFCSCNDCITDALENGMPQ